MQYELDRINTSVKTDPKGFAKFCDDSFNKKVLEAADLISANLQKSSIVFLSGPSGSGKTTTALKIEEELSRRGIKSHAISLDKYFLDVDPKTSPKTSEGDYDFESPDCLDMELLKRHFDMLEQHQEIQVPHFNFSTQKRSKTKCKCLRLGKNEIAIFEGIHALNDRFSQIQPNAFKLYVSVRSSFGINSDKIFKSSWIRMMRRVVRDNNFRGADAVFTLNLWKNIKRGEKQNIFPFEDKADYKFDSTIPYEISILKSFALPLLKKVPDNVCYQEDIRKIIDAFLLFEDMDSKFASRYSLIREFIGGGSYKY